MALIESVAAFTRRFHPRGTERLLRLFYHPDKIIGLRTVMPYDGDLKILIDTSSFLEWKTFFWGYYEPEITELIKKYLPPGGVFVDVGANVGVHTLIGAKIAKEVIAIEPAPSIADRLQGNLDLNRITNVRVARCVVSDVEGKMSFYLPGGATTNSGMGSLYEEHAQGSKIGVDAFTLDNLLDGKKVDLIKMDTEGNDGKVLLGARQTIRDHRPVIIFEYAETSWSLSGTDLETAKGVLEDYEFEMIGSPGNCNIVCVPKEWSMSRRTA